MLGRLFGRPSSPDSGSTSSLGLMIAVVFVASGFIFAQHMIQAPQGLDPRAGTLEADAGTALDLLVNTGGRTATGNGWVGNADAMTRFGLAQEGRPQFLDYAKIKELRNGTMTANGGNRAPDYPEVRAALGLRDADFHLRSYPVLMSVDDARWVRDSALRVAYFAHFDSASAPADISYVTTSTSSSLNVSVSITNRAAFAAAYTATISVGKQSTDATYITDERHTRLLLPGETGTVWVNFWSLQSWPTGTDGVKVVITDSFGNIAVAPGGDTVGSFWIGGITPPTSSPNSYNHIIHASAVYFESGRRVKFTIDHYDKNGDHVNNARARFVLFGPNGATWTNISVDLPHQKNKVYTYDCSNCTTVGNYTVVVWDTGVTRRHVERVHVSAERMFTQHATIAPLATKEIQLLGELTTGFNPTRYHPVTNPDGDIFGDEANGPNEIIDVLDRYTTLVVGSEVKQTSLNSAQTKYGIADWVKDAGGNLIVLGTVNQQSRWLEPVYHAAQQTANGGISAPDPTHPILVTPERLSYHRYLDRGRAWRIDNTEFTHVLNRGTAGNGGMLDTLAVSNPGAFNGTVVLTSYMPGSLTDPQDDAEAKRFLHNMLSRGHSMLFLDYGPPIPEGVPVGAATRLVVVPHPNVPGLEVEVRLVLYLFG